MTIDMEVIATLKASLADARSERDAYMASYARVASERDYLTQLAKQRLHAINFLLSVITYVDEKPEINPMMADHSHVSVAEEYGLPSDKCVYCAFSRERHPS